MRKLTGLAVTLGAATMLTGVLTGTALADPPSGTTPAATDVVGVGSDTTQFLFDQIAAAQNANSQYVRANGSVAGSDLYSYNATNPSTGLPGDMITTKTGATPITRPNGSGAGITALEQQTSATVDFARSSRARAATDPTTIKFVAYAGDAVTVTAGKGSLVKNLDTADLQAIYSCSVTTFNDLPDNPVAGDTDTIDPVLPQSGSGTRSFFLGAIGVTTPGACVNQNAEENQGNQPAVMGNADVIFPYSVAVALAQILHAQADGITTTTGDLQFPDLGGKFPAVKSGSTYVINPAFPTAFQRTIYDVVRQDTTTADQIPAYLEGLFGTSGALCKYGSGLISNFGFTPLKGAACGAVS